MLVSIGCHKMKKFTNLHSSNIITTAEFEDRPISLAENEWKSDGRNIAAELKKITNINIRANKLYS